MKRPTIARDSTRVYQQNLCKIFQDLKVVLPGTIRDVILNQKCLIHTSPVRNGEGDKSIQSKVNK